MIFRLLAEIGRWIETLVPPPPSVQAGVMAEADAAAEREVDELVASFDELLPVRMKTVAVAGKAAATSPEVVSAGPPAAPTSGCPNRFQK